MTEYKIACMHDQLLSNYNISFMHVFIQQILCERYYTKKEDTTLVLIEFTVY